MHEPKPPFINYKRLVIFAMQDMLAKLAGIYISTLMNTIAWYPRLALKKKTTAAQKTKGDLSSNFSVLTMCMLNGN